MRPKATSLTLLQRVQELLSDPEHWTTGDYALTADGLEVHATNKAATCWCVVGALQRAHHELTRGRAPGIPYYDALSALTRQMKAVNAELPEELRLPPEDVTAENFNDEAGYAPVMQALGRAIDSPEAH